MAADEPAGGGAAAEPMSAAAEPMSAAAEPMSAAAEPMSAAVEPMSGLAELLARHRPDSRRLRHLIALLTQQPLDLASLIQRSALPRQTVQSVLAAVAGDLVRDGDKAAIEPGKVPAYRQRFGYDQLACTELADPLAGRLGQAAAIAAVMTALAAEAPRARTDLDHVPATPETVVRRALWLDSSYDLAGAVLLFVGDHDLTSLAVGQVSPAPELVVVDVVEATLQFIDSRARRLGISVRCLAGDLRFGLPGRALGCADLVFTDPPYTPEGVELFAVRGLQGLGNRENGRVIVALGFSDLQPSLGFGAQAAAHRLGLAYEAVLPRFNSYDGAQALGSSSSLYVWRPTTRTWRVLDRPGADAAAGIYTRGPRSVEGGRPAFEEIPAAVQRVTSGAGFPVRVVVGSGWAGAGDTVARLRLGTLLSGGIPPGIMSGRQSSLVADLSGDPGPWLLRALLAANAGRVAALVPGDHRDLASEAAQDCLTALLAPKYRLRFLRGQPDARHAIVLAEAVAAETLDPPARLARRMLRQAHGKVGNAWREGLIDASRQRAGGPLSKRDARAMAEAGARRASVLDTRLIDLPRHQIAIVLQDARASAGRLVPVADR
jgi:predicted methyltransferase